MATQFIVKYEGSKQPVKYTVKPKHILRIERDGGGLEASIESSYKLAWLSANTDKEFEEWLDTVEDIEPVGDEDATTKNPT